MYHMVIFAGIGVEGRTLGASMLRHVASKHGYKIKIINFIENSIESIEDILKKYVSTGTIVGISTTYLPSIIPSNIRDISEKIRFYKKKMGFKVLLGGPSAKLAQQLFDSDYVISGYAENQIIEFLSRIFNNGIRKTSYMWDIKQSDYLWTDDEHIQHNETLPLEVGRGCIFKCKFCRFEMIGKKKGEYLRNISYIKDELIYNYENYNVVNYMLMDDTFNDDVYKLDMWNNMISTLPFKINYTAYLRADLLHRYQSVAKDLYSTGLRGGTFGIESLHPQASKIVGKAWSGKHARDFMPVLITEIFENKFLGKINFITGLPYETVESIQDTMLWLSTNKFYSASFLPLVISPNKLETTSEFDREYKKYGYEVDSLGNWKSRWMTKDIAKALANSWFSTNDTMYGGFQAFSKLSYLTINTLLTKTKKEILEDRENIIKRNSFFDNYFSQLLR